MCRKLKKSKSTEFSMRHKYSFTLIELLTVMALMAIISSIVIVGINGIFHSRSVDNAALMVRTDLILARQHAIAQIAKTAFLILDEEFFIDYAAPQTVVRDFKFYIGKAYAVYDLRNNYYLKPWTRLPEGVIFSNKTLPPEKGINVLAGPRNLSNENIVPKIPFSSLTGNINESNFKVDLYGIVFLPDGRILRKNYWYKWIILKEGTAVVAGIVERPGICLGLEVAYHGAIRTHEL